MLFTFKFRKCYKLSMDNFDKLLPKASDTLPASQGNRTPDTQPLNKNEFDRRIVEELVQELVELANYTDPFRTGEIADSLYSILKLSPPTEPLQPITSLVDRDFNDDRFYDDRYNEKNYVDFDELDDPYYGVFDQEEDIKSENLDFDPKELIKGLKDNLNEIINNYTSEESFDWASSRNVESDVLESTRKLRLWLEKNSILDKYRALDLLDMIDYFIYVEREKGVDEIIGVINELERLF